tara:strand:+ start:1626 stop:1982 length:357 start_codon:yes stop_codon:yes gene_type:complete
MPLPQVRKIRDEEERQLVIKAAIDDNDNMVYPTHLVEKNGDIVGGWSLGVLPLVLAWSKSDGINAKESLILRNNLSSIMNDRSPNPFVIACNDSSPYISYMKKFGYDPIWKTNLFISK